MRCIAALGFGLALSWVSPAAQNAELEQFAPEKIKKGGEIFALNCAPCHGSHMVDPQGAFDLRAFPQEQHARFVNSVTKGKNSMPPWGELFKSDDIEALWAYVVAGEKSP